MRVIAGSARGRRLVAPRGGARPTTDRVKESLFAALGADRVEGAAVLDLFAGSGALGIEALSRGASRAVFVDDDRRAVAAIRANLEATGLAERARIVAAPAAAALARSLPGAPFDLVFCDPPYDLHPDALAKVLTGLSRHGALAAGATVVLETRAGSRAAHGPGPVLPEGWSVGWRRAYGDTLLTVASPSPPFAIA